MLFSTSSLARGPKSPGPNHARTARTNVPRTAHESENSRTLKTIQRKRNAQGKRTECQAGRRGHEGSERETAKIPKSLASRDVKD